MHIRVCLTIFTTSIVVMAPESPINQAELLVCLFINFFPPAKRRLRLSGRLISNRSPRLLPSRSACFVSFLPSGRQLLLCPSYHLSDRLLHDLIEPRSATSNVPQRVVSFIMLQRYLLNITRSTDTFRY